MPVIPIALGAAVAALATVAATRWWLELLRRNGLLGALSDKADTPGGDGAASEAAPEWLVFCPLCRVHQVVATGRRCRRPGCAFPETDR